MPVTTFETEADATAFAQWASMRFKEALRVARHEAGFGVETQRRVLIRDLCTFAMLRQKTHLLMGRADWPQLATFFDDEARRVLQRPDLVWTDVATGLTWDAERLFGDEFTDSPGRTYQAMNTVTYGGYSDWRLPLRDELKTLTADTHFHLRLRLPDNRFGSSFWTSERIADPDEWYYVDIESMESGWQRFREQNRDRNTRGDGYQVSARTLYVRGSIE